MFDRAIVTANAFAIDLSNVFRSIAERCVSFTASERLRRPVSEDQVIIVSQGVSPYIPTDITDGASKRAWKLLEVYLDKFDSSATGFPYHRAVLEKILETDASVDIPAWILRIYKGPERGSYSDDYLRSLLKFDRLEEASLYAIELLNQGTNSNPRKYGPSSYDLPQSDSRCIPTTLIDILLDALDEAVAAKGRYVGTNTKRLARLRSDLEKAVLEYVESVRVETEDAIAANRPIR
ncbi:hypothetical protein M427DRAFT_476645 [Gonapodya prolifera JEL478]|uniref:NUP160 C-terminal TPR domain-containing protein n=1 Tax=Gonapodya prolifera (strain JEL478) TaxID=1344416 RepID=A0A139A112_GONPJ|nr:hypothetical protein M427DRAFT_476645 [Gonapodya prolifera JEL478]|eukprot:KXS10451.1 hypothetical protein M427DRAFT_476645 [Gonapodya prolifera JEL478]